MNVKQLLELSNFLESNGKIKEANYIKNIIKKADLSDVKEDFLINILTKTTNSGQFDSVVEEILNRGDSFNWSSVSSSVLDALINDDEIMFKLPIELQDQIDAAYANIGEIDNKETSVKDKEETLNLDDMSIEELKKQLVFMKKQINKFKEALYYNESDEHKKLINQAIEEIISNSDIIQKEILKRETNDSNKKVNKDYSYFNMPPFGEYDFLVKPDFKLFDPDGNIDVPDSLKDKPNMSKDDKISAKLNRDSFVENIRQHRIKEWERAVKSDLLLRKMNNNDVPILKEKENKEVPKSKGMASLFNMTDRIVDSMSKRINDLSSQIKSNNEYFTKDDIPLEWMTDIKKIEEESDIFSHNIDVLTGELNKEIENQLPSSDPEYEDQLEIISIVRDRIDLLNSYKNTLDNRKAEIYHYLNDKLPYSSREPQAPDTEKIFNASGKEVAHKLFEGFDESEIEDLMENIKESRKKILFRKLAFIANRLDEAGITSEADIIDDFLVRLAKEVEKENKYDSKKHHNQLIREPKTKEDAVDRENTKKHHVHTQQSINGTLSTRYCPEHIGVTMSRVGDGTFQCPIDGQVYNWETGWTDYDGNEHLGGSVAAQTPDSTGYATPHRMFDSRENILNALN